MVDTRMVSAAVAAMSVGIPAFMLSKVLLPAFYSRHDTKTPMKIAIYTVFVNVVLIVSLVTPMWYYKMPMAHVGIALATALAGIFNAAALSWYLKKEGVYHPEPGWRVWMIKIIAACVLMTISLLIIRWYVGDWRLLAGFWRIVWLLTAVSAGATVYLLSHWVFGLRLSHLREV